LGSFYFKKQQWSDAAVYFELYLEKVPEDRRIDIILYDLGRAYEEMGESNLAAEMYHIFIETVTPNDRRIKIVMARLEKLEGVTK